MSSSMTATVCDFPEPCTPQTVAEKGAFCEHKTQEITREHACKLTEFKYNRQSLGGTLVVFDLRHPVHVSLPPSPWHGKMLHTALTGLHLTNHTEPTSDLQRVDHLHRK
jgi:hypothetical protein